MKRLLIGACCALLVGLSGCQKPHSIYSDRQIVTVHHLRNGDYAYQDASGFWWWWFVVNQSQSSAWARGDAPSSSSLADEVAEVQETVSLSPAGEPAGAPAEAATEGGGTSIANTGPTAASPSVPAEASAPAASTPSAEAGGDAGGGGDGGGGGGE